MMPTTRTPPHRPAQAEPSRAEPVRPAHTPAITTGPAACPPLSARPPPPPLSAPPALQRRRPHRALVPSPPPPPPPPSLGSSLSRPIRLAMAAQPTPLRPAAKRLSPLTAHSVPPAAARFGSGPASSPGSPLAPRRSDPEDSQSDSGSDDEEHDRWQAYLSGPPTPGLVQTAEHLRRSLSIHALQQLGAAGARPVSPSARAQDAGSGTSVGADSRPRTPLTGSAPSSPPLTPVRPVSLTDAAKGLQRALTPKIWRPGDENPREPGDWERLFVHVVRGGLRAGLVSWGLRGTIFFVLALIGALRRGKVKRFSALFRVYTTPSNMRFGAMLGLWAFIYKAVGNTLRLLTPPPPPSSRKRSKSARSRAASDAADNQVATLRSIGVGERRQREWERERERRLWQRRPVYLRDPRSRVWHAYVAGALSALALLVESPSTRTSIAQQLFVRGLEGSYNILDDMGRVHVHHGAVIVFGLACGQIMWAWVNARPTLDRGYVKWILDASQACVNALTTIDEVTETGQVSDDKILTLFPGGVFPQPTVLGTATSDPVYAAIPPNKYNTVGISAPNVLALRKVMDTSHRWRVANAAFAAGTGPAPDPLDKVLHLPCAFMHPRMDNHLWEPFVRTYLVSKWILPVYLVLYLVPALFLRTKAFLRTPLKIIMRSLAGSLRSSLFLAMFVNLWQIGFCLPRVLQRIILERPALRARIPTWFTLMLGSPHWAGPAGVLTGLSLFVDDARRRPELAAYVLPKALESAWRVARAKHWVPSIRYGDLYLGMVGMSLVMGTYAQAPDHLSGLVRRVLYQFLGRN